MDSYQHANVSYIDDGVRLLEISQLVGTLFLTQTPREKGRLLAILCSNSTWMNGELEVEFRQPFDIIVDANRDITNKNAAQEVQDSEFGNWSGRGDLNPRPPAPEAGALPSCATPRQWRHNQSRFETL